MVPNFALSLSFEGIALLRRRGDQSGDQWAQIQEVSLDSGDLEAAVLTLRNRAEELDPDGAKVALIIPNEQIRYLDVPDLGGDDAAKEIAARTALDGATPYAVDDLVFDYVDHDGRLLIAAVAKETLQEAEAFASQNGFDPVSHAAIAEDGQFHGSVFFGASSAWTGPAPQRFPHAITVYPAEAGDLLPLQAETLPEDAPVETTEVEEPAPEQVAEQETVAEPAEAPAQTELDLAPPAEITAPADMAEPAVEADEPAASLPPVQDLVQETLKSTAPVQEPAETPIATEEPSQTKAEAPVAPAETQAAPGTAPADRPATEVASPEATQDPVAEPDPEPEAAPVSFSTIRASRDSSDLPEAPKGKALAAGDGPVSQVKSRFTPVAAKGEEPAKTTPDAVTDPALDVPRDEEPKAEPAVAKRAEPPVSAPKPPAAPKAVAPETDPSKDDAPETTVAAPALARLAALRARSDKPVETPAPVAVETPDQTAPDPKGKRGALAGIAARRKSTADAAPAAPEAVQPNDAGAQGKSALGRIAALRSTSPKPDQTTDTGKAASLTSAEESERMTVFGARNRDNIGGKPRFLGLFLTAGLLLFMAGVAAWASVFLDDGLAGLFRSEPDETNIVAVAPEITPELAVADPALLPSDDGAEEADDVQLASLDTGLDDTGDATAVTDAPRARAVPVAPHSLTPEEAAATYAATGIWQRAPVAPLEPPVDGVEDIYVASIDPAVQESDAIALPDPLNLAQEPILEPQRLPPPAGQVFDMDERGLVRATPEGALSPDGLRVFAGLPPVVPPQRQALATPAEPETAAPQINEALSKIRPRLRPDTLIETRERAQLGGISRAELAAIRPVMRPKTAQEQAVAEEPEAPATAQAVNRSLAPVGRPRNMNAIVRRAERNQDAAPVAPVQTAAIAPRTVTPAAPTSRGVAASATVRNAINLNKVNLIGVYGTPANRRALVRLPNGKYKKVKVGDRLDGGRVAAIGDSELRYTKSGRNVTLKMPRS
ncbi:hypothetical protein TRP8649_03129 [Pelagimonas phthalicica]|uniref:Type IV pilus biogenesis n=1 Tax=Pelagimonas phthalicica TaxID=1037362 RepID=A0A238JE89_9RHOB|nr:hypothetical protein [Pelagimonas phthalicica]TDS91951.1 hypothetical protein CLV87_3130 [Pelagimonas phthalicica]SMX29001.1 hypothetical protein TRP8649_03129 [Pelagimonas phthalicica]